MAQSVVLLSVTEEERKRKLKTDSLGKTQRSERLPLPKGRDCCLYAAIGYGANRGSWGVEGGKSALHAKSHTKVRQGAGTEKGGCVFSIDLSAFNCRQAANKTRPADTRSGELWYVPQRINLNILRQASTHSRALTRFPSLSSLKL